MKHLLRSFLGVCAALWLFENADARPGPRVELVRHVAAGIPALRTPIVFDFNDDGKDEVLLLDEFGFPIVLGWDSKHRRLRGELIHPHNFSAIWRLQRLTGKYSGRPDSIAAISSNRVSIISQGGFTADYPLRPDCWACLIADINLDGSPDVVYIEKLPVPAVHAIDLASGNPIWSRSIAETSSYDGLMTAQLDADAQPEVVLKGRPFLILDGLTGAVEWEADDVGVTHLLVGNFDEDSLDELLVAGYDQYTVIDSQPYRSLPAFNRQRGSVPTLFDVNGDGRDFLLEPIDGGFRVRELPGGLTVREVAVPYAGIGETVVLGGQLVGSGSRSFLVELWPIGSTNESALLLDSMSGATLGAIPKPPGLPLAVALADLDEDGKLELITGGVEYSLSGREQPLLRVRSYDHGGERFAITSVDLFGVQGGQVRGIAVGNGDDVPGMDILLAGKDTHATVLAIDPRTRGVRWRFDRSPAVLHSNFRAIKLKPDSMGPPLLALEYRNDCCVVEIVLLNGSEKREVWTSSKFEVGSSSSSQMAFVDIDFDGETELIVGSDPGIRALSKDGSLLWSRNVPSKRWTIVNGTMDILTCDNYGDGRLLDASSGADIVPIRVNDRSSYVEALIPLEPGFFLVIDGEMSVLDTGTTDVIPLLLSRPPSEVLSWHLAPSGYPGKQLLIIPHRYGFSEYEVWSSLRIFGANEGGFEARPVSFPRSH